MDLSDPTRAVTPTLDGPVLAALAAAGRPLTVGEVAVRAARGSEIGVRRTLARLVSQGIVRATLMGRNTVHELNREHVAASVAESLAGLRLELWRRLRAELSAWEPRPLVAIVFGSAARHDGDLDSDIDLLLVHPLFPGEVKPPEDLQATWLGIAATVATTVVVAASPSAATSPSSPEAWQSQVDRLRRLVLSWTGNDLQVVDLSVTEWVSPGSAHRPLLEEVRRDGIEMLSRPGPPSMAGDS